MKDLIKLMSAEGTTNVREALGKFMRDDRQIAGWQAIVDELGILERTEWRLKGPGSNGTYLSPREAVSVSITEFKVSETPALALENACFERLRPVPNWRFRLSKCCSDTTLYSSYEKKGSVPFCPLSGRLRAEWRSAL